MHRVTQELHPSQQQLLNRSWDMDRPPPQIQGPPPPGVQGLDRAWEIERARGMEMLHRYVKGAFVSIVAVLPLK